MLKLHLLGTFQLTQNAQTINSFESDKAKALLAYLALQKRPIARATLAALFWPEHDEKRANGNLRRVLTNLRAVAPDCLIIERQSAAWRADAPCWVDAVAFQQAASGNVGHMVWGCTLYRGVLLEGFGLQDSAEFELWLVGERERFQQRYINLLDKLIAHHNELGEWEEALRYAQQLVRAAPWRESSHRQLMLLLARTGRRSAALQQFERCKTLLHDEFSVAPTRATKNLAIRIANMADDAVGLPNRGRMTPFVGRSADLETLVRLLIDTQNRLITLVGLGGMGKTRLATEAALRAQPRFLDGVWFVDLVGISDQNGLISQIARTLAISPSAETTLQEQVIGTLRGRESLLILDNFEQLVDSADMLIDLLDAAPDVTLLITSRERLNLWGETLFEVNGLPLESDAFELFVQNAKRVRRNLLLTADQARHVVEICRLVNGHPLGIELAASWVRSLSLSDIAAEIDQSLAFLHGTQRNLPSRHRSSEAVFHSSWRLLSGEEQRVLAALSIFDGTFDRHGAAVVAETNLATLGSLIDKSLLRQSDGRYSLHPLVREFSAEKRPTTPALTNRHAAHYLALVAAQRDAIFAVAPAAVALLQAEEANIFQAWQQCAATGQLAALHAAHLPVFFIYEVWQTWPQRFFRLAADGLPPAREQANPEQPETVHFCLALLAALAYLQTANGQIAGLDALLAEALDVRTTYSACCVDQSAEYAITLSILAYALYGVDAIDIADQISHQTVEIATSAPNRQLAALALSNLHLAHFLRGDYAGAKRYIERSIAIRQASHPHALPSYYVDFGLTYEALGELDTAEALYHRLIAAVRLQNVPINTAYLDDRLANVAFLRGDFARAEQLLSGVIAGYAAHSIYSGQLIAMCVLAVAKAAQGDTDAALAVSDDAVGMLVSSRPSFLHAYTLAFRARVLFAHGQLAASDAAARAALASALAVGSLMMGMECIFALGRTALLRGEFEVALPLLGYAAAASATHYFTRLALDSAISTLTADQLAALEPPPTLDEVLAVLNWS